MFGLTEEPKTPCAIWMEAFDALRDRLREIEDTLRTAERISGKGSDPAAALAQLSPDDYAYIRRLAILP